MKPIRLLVTVVSILQFNFVPLRICQKTDQFCHHRVFRELKCKNIPIRSTIEERRPDFGDGFNVFEKLKDCLRKRLTFPDIANMCVNFNTLKVALSCYERLTNTTKHAILGKTEFFRMRQITKNCSLATVTTGAIAMPTDARVIYKCNVDSDTYDEKDIERSLTYWKTGESPDSPARLQFPHNTYLPKYWLDRFHICRFQHWLYNAVINEVTFKYNCSFFLR